MSNPHASAVTEYNYNFKSRATSPVGSSLRYFPMRRRKSKKTAGDKLPSNILATEESVLQYSSKKRVERYIMRSMSQSQRIKSKIIKYVED